MTFSMNRTLRCLALLCLVCAVSSAYSPDVFADDSAAQFDPDASRPRAITVTTHATIADLSSGAISLIGIYPAEDDGSPLFTLEWRMEPSSWLPSWHLYLVGEWSALGPAQTMRTGAAPARVRLATLTPARGVTYEAKLSYDPETGLAAVSVVNAATRERLVRAGVRLAPYGGEITALAPNGAGEPAIAPGYAPLDLRWDVGIYTGGEYLPIRFLRPGEDNRVRVNVQGPLPGEFVLLSQKGSEVRVVGRYPAHDGANVLAIPPDALALGPSTLVLQYVDRGLVTFSDALDIEVGRITARLGAVRFDRQAGRFEAGLQLAGNGAFAGVEANARVDVWALEWDPAAKAYRETLYASHTLAIEDFGDVAGRNGEAAIAIPAPVQKGLWRLEISLATLPEVSVQMDRASRIVATHDPADIAPGEPYTIVVLPDTQLYAKFHPEIYLRQTEWIASRAAAQNIAFVLHLGDVTEDNFPEQWAVARDAHDALSGVAPYVLAVGNHDYAQSGRVADRNDTLVNEFFSAADFPHLRGWLKAGRLENTYHTFSVAGRDYLVISLEFAPSDEALAWANTVAAAHPSHRIIVITHAYLQPSGVRLPAGASARTFPLGSNRATTMNDGDEIWEKFASRHPNVFMILSGHISSSVIPHRTSIGVNGNAVYEILADYQSETNGGNGYLVLMEFAPDGPVRVRSYSPYLDSFKAGVDRYGFSNDFVIDAAP